MPYPSHGVLGTASVIGQELVHLFLREAATVPFNLMGVGQAHLEGGKQIVRGDIIVPVSPDGVVMARCRDATIYIANVGPRCILGFPFFARYGIHINIEPPCFMFEEDVGRADISAGLTAGVNAPAPHLWVQSREITKPSIEASANYVATHDAFFEVQNSGSDSVGHQECLLGATADAVHSVSQVALHSPDADVPSEPPMVLEIPPHQVSPSSSSPAHVFPVLSCMLALCTSSAALHLADQSRKHSDHRTPRSIAVLSHSTKDVSNMRVISHVDWPLFQPLKVYSIFCISAAILMYSPTPQSAAIGCITPLFERHELILYDTLRSGGEYFPLMAISGFRTDPDSQSTPSVGISGIEAGPSATELDNDTPRSQILQMISAEK